MAKENLQLQVGPDSGPLGIPPTPHGRASFYCCDDSTVTSHTLAQGFKHIDIEHFGSIGAIIARSMKTF